MKVVCESCQAKYQVPDERVAGKKLKIRCKRCGATVLIRGDLAQSGAAPAVESPSVSMPVTPVAAEEAPALEWHVSLDGDSRGPFETEELLVWLAQQPGAWDAHVWREGFADWIEARQCAELGPAPAQYDSMQEDEAPTQTFDSAAVAPFMAAAGSRRSGVRGGENARSAASSIRSRSPSGISTGASPRVNGADALTGERHEDSVLFHAQNLQTMTNSAPAYNPGPNPGFAGGDGSGLIDIRALASLARQTRPQAGASASQSGGYAVPDNGFSFGNEVDEEARIALMNQSSAFGRVDSLAPVSSAARTSSVAVPLAILGGCALVAAAVFAAILIARPSKSSQPVAVTVPAVAEQDSVGAAAQPTETPEAPMAAPAADEPPPSAAEPAAASDAPKAEGAVIAAGKARGKARGSRAASDEKKSSSPEEKTKPKKEGKSQPPSLDEVMLADKAKPPAKPAPEPTKAEPAKGGTDIDTLLGAKPAKQPSKSIDDLLSGAVEKGSKGSAKTAPAPGPSASSEPAAGSDLPETPSRDETLAAMRGVESAVRACAEGQNVTGTAEVQMNVAGATGRVSTATVTGITGAVGSCIARAVRNAKFPHFSKSAFAIKFPYRF